MDDELTRAEAPLLLDSCFQSLTLTMQDTVTHVAGIIITIGGRTLQRCAVCGEKLYDSGSELPGRKFPPSSYIRMSFVELETTILGNLLEDDIPSDTCVNMVEA